MAFRVVDPLFGKQVLPLLRVDPALPRGGAGGRAEDCRSPCRSRCSTWCSASSPGPVRWIMSAGRRPPRTPTSPPRRSSRCPSSTLPPPPMLALPELPPPPPPRHRRGRPRHHHPAGRRRRGGRGDRDAARARRGPDLALRGRRGRRRGGGGRARRPRRGARPGRRRPPPRPPTCKEVGRMIPSARDRLFARAHRVHRRVPRDRGARAEPAAGGPGRTLEVRADQRPEVLDESEAAEAGAEDADAGRRPGHRPPPGPPSRRRRRSRRRPRPGPAPTASCRCPATPTRRPAPRSQGDNGGATSRGVTGDTITVAVRAQAFDNGMSTRCRRSQGEDPQRGPRCDRPHDPRARRLLQPHLPDVRPQAEGRDLRRQGRRAEGDHRRRPGGGGGGRAQGRPGGPGVRGHLGGVPRLRGRARAPWGGQRRRAVHVEGVDDGTAALRVEPVPRLLHDRGERRVVLRDEDGEPPRHAGRAEAEGPAAPAGIIAPENSWYQECVRSGCRSWSAAAHDRCSTSGTASRCRRCRCRPGRSSPS